MCSVQNMCAEEVIRERVCHTFITVFGANVVHRLAIRNALRMWTLVTICNWGFVEISWTIKWIQVHWNHKQATTQGKWVKGRRPGGNKHLWKFPDEIEANTSKHPHIHLKDDKIHWRLMRAPSASSKHILIKHSTSPLPNSSSDVADFQLCTSFVWLTHSFFLSLSSSVNIRL